MDFSRVALADDDQTFLAEAREFLTTHVTDEVRRRDRETGDNFDEGVHLALGAAGYLERMERGVRRWLPPGPPPHLGTGEAPRPRAVGDLGDHRDGGAFGGEVRFAGVAGRGDAEGVQRRSATVPGIHRTRRRLRHRDVQDPRGARWRRLGRQRLEDVHHRRTQLSVRLPDHQHRPRGSKTQEPDHVSGAAGLAGIDIQGIRTVDGDRTNIVYYSDVRVDDKYRLGEVNGGWTVLREPLNTEHGAVAAAPDGLQDVSIMMHQASFMTHALDKTAAKAAERDPNGHRLVDDASVAYRLGRSAARIEAALSAPSIFGRVAIAQTMRDVSPELMDLLGTASTLPLGTDGAADDGASEYVYRFAPLVGIYGGTLEVFRNMIAQYVLGLGKPNYSAPKKVSWR